MARELSVTVSMRVLIRSGSLTLIDWKQPHSGSFTRTLTGIKGPTPGALTATEDGIDIDFSELTVLGPAFVVNQSATHSLDLGLWNPDQTEFYPLLRIPPGEGYPLPLHPDLNEEYLGTGTGTTGQLNTFRAKGVGASVNFYIGAFEA